MSWIDCGNVRILILFTIEVMIATVKIKRSISVVSHLRRHLGVDDVHAC